MDQQDRDNRASSPTEPSLRETVGVTEEQLLRRFPREYFGAAAVRAVLEAAALARTSPEVRGGGEWEAHSGEDYTVVMRPNETTESASIQVYGEDREALGLRIAAALASPPAEEWRPIETIPDDDRLILAVCPACDEFPDGRVMVWRSSMLKRNLSGPTPHHLSFPATHWRPLPPAPAGEGK